MHKFSNLFDNVLYMLRTGPLSNNTRHCVHAVGICHASSVGCLHPDHVSRQPTELAGQIPTACIQRWDTPDGGLWTCPKQVEYFIK